MKKSVAILLEAVIIMVIAYCVITFMADKSVLIQSLVIGALALVTDYGVTQIYKKKGATQPVW